MKPLLFKLPAKVEAGKVLILERFEGKTKYDKVFVSNSEIILSRAEVLEAALKNSVLTSYRKSTHISYKSKKYNFVLRQNGSDLDNETKPKYIVTFTGNFIPYVQNSKYLSLEKAEFDFEKVWLEIGNWSKETDLIFETGLELWFECFLMTDDMSCELRNKVFWINGNDFLMEEDWKETLEEKSLRYEENINIWSSFLKARF